MKVASLRSAQGGWTLLQLDNLSSLADGLGWSDVVTSQQALRLLRQVIAGWSPLCSGLLLEAEYGLPLITHKAKKVGVALRLESPLSSDPLAPPLLEANWGVEEIRANYAVVKLGLYFHPSEAQALAKKQFLAEIADYCRYVGVELVLDWHWLVGPSAGVSAAQDADAYMWAAQELAMYAQLLVVPPPPDALTGASLTAELDIPWLVKLDQADYAQAKDCLRQALEAGSQGALIGQALWSGAPKVSEAMALGPFLQGEARDRLIELRRIIDESVAAT